MGTAYPAGHQMIVESNRGQAPKYRQMLEQGGWTWTEQPQGNRILYHAECR